MDATTIVQRLRTFLLVLAGCMCVGTSVELFLAKHPKSPIQLIPFVLCGVGLIVVLAALLRPRRATLIALRLVMALLMVGGLVGVVEHIQSNLAFELDIRPSASVSAVVFDALRGAAPLLAPGILALAAILAIAATYYHPALSDRRNTALSNEPGRVIGRLQQ
jgi:hypothetical protein